MRKILIGLLLLSTLNAQAIPLGGACKNDNGATKGGCDPGLVCAKSGVCASIVLKPTVSPAIKQLPSSLPAPTSPSN